MPHSVNLPFISVSLVALSQHLAPISSDPIEFPPVGSHLEPEAATVPMDLIAPDVRPLPSPSVECSAHVLVVDDLPPLSVLHDIEWLPGWQIRLGEPHQLGTIAPPMIAGTVGRRRHWDPDDNKLIVSINS